MTDAIRVYWCIHDAGWEGTTDDEIEVALGLPHQTASARRRGLVLRGLVGASGKRRRTRRDRTATVWVTSDLVIDSVPEDPMVDLRKKLAKAAEVELGFARANSRYFEAFAEIKRERQ